MKVLQLVRQDPTLSNMEIYRWTGVSESTVRSIKERYLKLGGKM